MDNEQLDQWGLGETDEQRKASSLHYVVDKMANGEKKEPTVNRLAVALLTGVVTDVLDTVGSDLAAFAKHRKGKFINEKDVLLCARKNEKLSKKLRDYRADIALVEDAKVLDREAINKRRRGPDDSDDEDDI